MPRSLCALMRTSAVPSRWALPILLSALLFGVLLRLTAGGLGADAAETRIFLQLRVFQLFAGLLAGGSLALAGVCVQALLRNPLASPDLLGIASGAAFGVTLSALAATGIGASVALAGWSAPIAALIGATATLVAVYILSQRRGFVDPLSVVLVGVVISVMVGAASAAVRAMLPDGGVAIGRLLVGAIRDDLRMWDLWVGALVLGCGLGVAVGIAPKLDLLAVGEDEAASMGVSVARARVVLFGLAGVLTALSVWIAGPLAFVGLVAPHFVRLLVGPEHRVVVPLSVLAGAALVVLSDGVVELASRNLHIGRIPVGVVTAVVGGPVFIVLLRRHLKGSNQLA